MVKNELNFEDLVFKEDKNESDYLELPLSRQTFLLVGVVIILIGAVALGRLGFLGVLKGAFYSQRALANANKEVDLPAPRGIIFDRFRKPLVVNKSSFSVFLSVSELLKSPAALTKTIETVSGILGLEAAGVEKIIQRADLEKRSFVPIGRNISVAQAIELRGLNSPAVQVEDDYVRDYLDPSAFSHVLGYVGVSENDQSIIGKSGLELQYDSALKGKDGRLLIYRDASGRVLDNKVAEAPEVGGELVTTIDAELQQYFYDRLKSALANLGRDSGVGIALNPQNGEVLALMSLPSFDSTKVAKFLNNSRQPLFNRAISGAYTPGSTIKPLVALAALKESIVSPDFQILSTGSIEIANPYDPEKPSRFLDWKAHGWVDLHSALARSSNVYFYALGGGLPRESAAILRGFGNLKGLGIARLRSYWGKFLLGVKTGIDLPSEGAGFLPDAEEKEARTGQIWRIGDTYNVSIGQGDLLLTPLQLINFIASLANGGKIYRPHLIPESPESLFDYSGWEKEIQEVRQGMVDAVKKPYGTANLLTYLPMSAAAKTGSSQVANNARTNAFFVGYAPAENPQIAILVLIENAKEGSLNAVPVAKDVFEWYYHNRLSQ